MGKFNLLNQALKIYFAFIVCIISFSDLLALELKDSVYHERIKTVQLYLDDGSEQAILNSAINTLDFRNKLVLEFDELGDQAKYYYAKIYHCNMDWTKSSLADAEFMNEYNEFLIQDYDFSFSTKQNFTHYRFELPEVKVSGNYLLLIYPSDNINAPIISMRFMIIENIVSIRPEFKISEMVGRRNEFQQTGFQIFYDRLNIIVPQNEISVTIRQNQRWDNAKYDLKPLYFDESNGVMDFRYFDMSTNFPGWNEFRNFAFRNMSFEDANVEDMDAVNRELTVTELKPRANRTYVNFIDLNGEYVIENNLGANKLSSDYFTINIFFQSRELGGSYYFVGNHNNWKKNQFNKFNYNEELKQYEIVLRMKQGYYDYMVEYAPKEDEDLEPWAYEGSFFQTQNDYEIIVYWREIGSRFDRIIGYLNRPFFNR